MSILRFSKLLAVAFLCLCTLSGLAQSPTFGPPISGPQTFSGPITVPDAILNGPRIDVRYYGAKADGVTDNCTALTNATTYAATQQNSVLYIPFGIVQTSCTVQFLSNWYVEGKLKAIAGGTAVSTALVSTGSNTAQVMDHKGMYGPGLLDGAGISPVLVWMMQGQHVNISIAGIIGLAPNGKGIYAGDDAAVGAGGFELYVDHVGFGLRSNPAHAGSVCIYISGGDGTGILGHGQFTDNVITNNTLHDCALAGYQDHVGGNNNFSNNHAWDSSPIGTCFEIFAGGATLTNEYCDTPSTYGFRIHGVNTRIIGGTAYMGTGGVDNTGTAFQFDTLPDPIADIVGVNIIGQDATHRWAVDTNLGFASNLTLYCGMMLSNVVTSNAGGACLLPRSVFSGSTRMRNGVFFSAPANISCTSTCTFSLDNSNFHKATLTANATSTITSVNSYSKQTIMICQPASGGPFTFTPPANSVGFGTIGTTSSKCSVQDFVWDGTTLRATSTMQPNE